MTRYQCISCEATQITAGIRPDACRHCAGPVFDLDRYEAAIAEAQIIGAQNDAFRAALGQTEWQGETLRGRVVVTCGIVARGRDFVDAALDRVRTDASVVDDHGTDGLRSFGMPDVPHGDETVRIYWKIDLYDTDGLMGPEQESDPAQTIRVLTLCLPDEY